MKTQSNRIIYFGLLTAVAAYFAAGIATAQVPTPVTKDKVASRVGVFRGGSAFTLDAGGRTGLAGDRAVDFGMGTGPVYVQDATFLNALAQNDEITFAFWANKYDIADGSAFWANSPSSSGSGRGAQAHVPWSNGNLYWDTAGCCNPPQRINALYSSDLGWWQTWHFFVFTKKGANKEIWVDGALFLDQQTAQPGVNAAPLPTDFTDLYIGSDGTGAGLFHALVDDFSIYGTALSSSSITALYTGTLPSALPPTDQLTAWWDFNDFPAEGVFLSITPAAHSTAAAPDLIRIVHTDGDVPWTAANITLKVDGGSVTPTFVRDGLTATVSYVPSPAFIAYTLHKVSLTYPAGVATNATIDWEFIVGAYTKDVVEARSGVFTGGSIYTSDGGGHLGGAGNRAADFGRGGTGPVHVPDGTFLNPSATNDEMSVGFWIKKPQIEAGSAFWFNSPSAAADRRGYQAHVPWSDSVIYFDSAGCCNAGETRISANINTFLGYSGDVSWWTNWHYFVFQKRQFEKEIWIDGQIFLTGTGNALPTDFTDLFIGATAPGVNLISGQIDDFAVFGTALTADTITALFGGTLPTAVDATNKLTAYWNFNDFPSQGVFVSIIPTPWSTNARPDLVQVVHLDGTNAWDSSEITLKVDDVAVTPVFVKDGVKATVSYLPSPMFLAGSTHKAALTYPGASGTPETLEWQFTIGTYPVTISQDLWTAPGTGDSTKPGLKARVWQVDVLGTVIPINYVYRAEQELAGALGPNVADLNLATDGIFTNDVVNWNQDWGTAPIGNFQPDAQIPGIPGWGTRANDAIAAEVITYVEFPVAGYYVMGVNSDDGFRVTVADTPPANNQALVVTGADSAAGSYYAVPAPAATAKPITGPISGTLVYMDPADGCTTPVNAAALSNNVALVDRGTCEFSAKIKAAKDAGAIAAVVVNNRTDDVVTWPEGIYPIEMGVGVAGYQDIPAVMISYPDGEKIKSGLTNVLTASVTPDTTPIVGEFNAGRGSSDTLFPFIVPVAGLYPFRCVWFEGDGGANLEWFSVSNLGEKMLINDRAKPDALKSFRARTVEPQPRPTISITAAGGTVTITFTGILQAADTPAGTWEDLAVASPYPVPTTGLQKFYRSKR